MSVFSLVLYLWSEQHDWQIARDTFGGFERYQYLSGPGRPDQCTKVRLGTVQDVLRRAGNAFAGFSPLGLPFDYMCLPPNSKLKV
jgi:hypothetical protein